jgi:hypothetical protein
MELGHRAQATGSATRAGLWLRVALAGVLFAVLALLLTRLAERPSLRVRMDWTQAEENTLSPASMEVLARLPEQARIDVFLRPAEFPLEELVILAQERLRQLLLSVRDSSGGKVLLFAHDLTGSGAESARTRLFELGLREVDAGGLLVVSQDSRREVLRLRGDLADFDPGDPSGQQGPPSPPRLVSFRAEEALVGALLKVGASDAPSVLFVRGHGELDLDNVELMGLSELKGALESDGYRVGNHEFASAPSIPEDCRVLALLGPEQPLAEAEWVAIKRFVESGGRLIVAPGLETVAERFSVADLLEPWGLRVARSGFVARAPLGPGGAPQYGTNTAAQLWLERSSMGTHPITDPLRRAERRVIFNGARALEIGRGLPGGNVLALLRSPEGAWLDLPLEGGKTQDWKPEAGERQGPFVLAAAILFPPQAAAGPPRRSSPAERPEARVVVLSSAVSAINATFETNRDFLLNAFNWAASRDWRVKVEAREAPQRRLDLAQPDAVRRLWLWIALAPVLSSLALGLAMAWRRRR